jgi:hypothetical protein
MKTSFLPLAFLSLLAVHCAPAADATESPEPQSQEAAVSSRITVQPANDDCADVVRAFTNALLVSSGYAKAKATLTSETEYRDYELELTPRAPETLPVHFTLVTSNDSASKCWFDSLTQR